MLSLAALLLTNTPDANAVAAKFERYMKGAQSLSVQVKVRQTGYPGEGTGELILARPNRIRFIGKWGVFQYGFIQNNQGIIEWDSASQQYREYATFPTWAPPAGELSDFSEAMFPLPLPAQSLRVLLAEGSNFMLDGLQSPRSSVLVARATTVNGNEKYTIKVDEIGRIISIKFEAGSGLRAFKREMQLSNYNLKPTIGTDTFKPVAPAGFSPAALPTSHYMRGPGENFPTAGWKSVKTGQTVDLKRVLGGKTMLLATVQSDCSQSKALVNFFNRNASAFAKSNIACGLIVTQGATPSFSGSLPVFSDPSGALIRELRIGGTPSFWLVKPSGEVAQPWFGFSEKSQLRLKSEILSAAKR
jgi:outer membrane lipoprotein-sorting protein